MLRDPLTFAPVSNVVDAVSVFVDPQAMFLAPDILSIVNILFRFPFQPKTMLTTLIKILGLPSSQISSSVEVPDHAHISSNQHCAVSVLLDHKVLVRNFQLMEYGGGSLV